jgi:hypothetical protein
MMPASNARPIELEQFMTDAPRGRQPTLTLLSVANP